MIVRSPRVVLRAATAADVDQIMRLVGSVVREVYGHLIPELPPLDAAWDTAHIAEADGTIVGVMLAVDDRVEDLWIAPGHRGAGIGASLLQIAEADIAARCLAVARLRVVSENEGALRFYRREGWIEVRRYPSERFGFVMVDFVKPTR